MRMARVKATRRIFRQKTEDGFKRLIVLNRLGVVCFEKGIFDVGSWKAKEE